MKFDSSHQKFSSFNGIDHVLQMYTFENKKKHDYVIITYHPHIYFIGDLRSIENRQYE